MSNRTKPERLRNYARSRQRFEDELPWARPDSPELQELARPVILINGAFDMLHSGHMKLIFAARKRAGRGTVVCALDSDRKITESKGKGRPVMSWIERATALGYMPIDQLVEIDKPEDMTNLIATLQPDERVQGSDYLAHQSTYPTPKLFVRDAGMHTSTIVKRIQSIPTEDLFNGLRDQ